MEDNTDTDGRASAAISGKLIVVDWNVIVVGDKRGPGVQVVPGGREGWKDGGTEGGSLTQTEESLN